MLAEFRMYLASWFVLPIKRWDPVMLLGGKKRLIIYFRGMPVLDKCREFFVKFTFLIVCETGILQLFQYCAKVTVISDVVFCVD